MGKMEWEENEEREVESECSARARKQCRNIRNLIARLWFICIETRYDTDKQCDVPTLYNTILYYVLVHLVISKVYIIYARMENVFSVCVPHNVSFG